MHLIKRTIRLTCFGISFITLTAAAQTARVEVDAAKVLNRIPAKLYGSCIEDVNHEIYGGLYAQRIFGESFEEPPATASINGWAIYGGLWTAKNTEVNVKADPGAKLVLNQDLPENYTIQTSLKFGAEKNVAGLLLHVNNPRPGADSFEGYEISIDPRRQILIFGKHVNNWIPLQEVRVSFDPAAWIKLKVAVKNNTFVVYINNSAEPAATLTDNNKPLKPGRVALRTFGSDVTYKDFAVDAAGKTITGKFSAAPLPQVSGMWDAINTSKTGSFLLDAATAVNGSQSQVMVHRGGKGVVGVANRSLNRWGIAINKGKRYTGSVYLKADALKGAVTLQLQSVDGTKTYASAALTGISGQWKRYTFNLTPNASDSKGQFVIAIGNTGKLWVDQVSLIIADEQFKGLPLRADIAVKMQQEGLNFLRYGGTMVNAAGYRFKKMIGPRDKRPPYTGHWYPYSTNGFGIEDFLQFSEAAGFEAAFAINIEETPQDVADMVEYLKGDATTPWGKQRAQNGHPAPYKVKYIEIGNEEVIFNGDVTAEYEHYVERFNLLYDAMHAKDTSIKFICSAWWRPESANMAKVFKGVNGKADYWDLHTDADDPRSGIKVDSSLKQMRALFTKWDPATRLKCAIFEENGGRHDLARALGHATTLNAVRRHGDFVLTSCAANALQPLGQNDNGWDQGQIFFTPTQVWGMPPFYAQQMAAANHLPLNVSASATAGLDVTATTSEDGRQLILHIVNPSGQTVPAGISIDNFAARKNEVTFTQLTGKLGDVNTLQQPEQISTKQNKQNLPGNVINYEFPAASYTIIKLTR